MAERIGEMSKATDTGIVSVINQDENNRQVLLEYRRIGGTVQLYGQAVDTAGGTFFGQIATGLPRPAKQMRIQFADGFLTLETDGTLKASTTMSRVYFDGITYLTTPSYNTADGHLLSSVQQEH